MIFELLFLLLLLTSFIALVTVLVLMLRRTRRTAMLLLQGLGVGWAIYLVIVAIVGAATPQRIVPVGQNLCFDEMCFAVAHAEVVTQLGQESHPLKANGRFYVVAIRASSRSRGRAQSEGGLRPLLWDSGRYYEVSPEGQVAWEAENGLTAKLTARLQPGESVLSVQIFDVAPEVATPGLVLSHGFTPGYFVIGECPLFHKPTILQLRP